MESAKNTLGMILVAPGAVAADGKSPLAKLAQVSRCAILHPPMLLCWAWSDHDVVNHGVSGRRLRVRSVVGRSVAGASSLTFSLHLRRQMVADACSNLASSRTERCTSLLIMDSGPQPSLTRRRYHKLVHPHSALSNPYPGHRPAPSRVAIFKTPSLISRPPPPPRSCSFACLSVMAPAPPRGCSPAVKGFTASCLISNSEYEASLLNWVGAGLWQDMQSERRRLANLGFLEVCVQPRGGSTSHI